MSKSTLAKFYRLGTVGTTYGEVYKVKRFKDEICIKRVNVEHMTTEEQRAAISECNIMASLTHRHICKYYDSLDKVYLILSWSSAQMEFAATITSFEKE